MYLPRVLEWFNHYYIFSSFVKAFSISAENRFSIIRDDEWREDREKSKYGEALSY
jgi:hypothetical protein